MELKELTEKTFELFGVGGIRMTVDEKISELIAIINALKEKYCENCQEYCCDMCPYLMEESDG